MIILNTYLDDSLLKLAELKIDRLTSNANISFLSKDIMDV